MAKQSSLMGLARVQRRLDKIPKEIKNQVKSQMEQEAAQIVAAMRGAVPVNTGALRNSIKWTWGKPDKKDTVLAMASSALGGEMVITIYAGYSKSNKKDGKGRYRDLPIARWVEFGTQHIEKRPFFYGTWRMMRKRTQGNVRKSVGKAVKAATK